MKDTGSGQTFWSLPRDWDFKVDFKGNTGVNDGGRKFWAQGTQSNHCNRALKLCSVASTEVKMVVTCSEEDEMSVR